MNIILDKRRIIKLTDSNISIQSSRDDSSYERKNVSFHDVSEQYLHRVWRSLPTVCQEYLLTPWNARGRVNCPWKACVQNTSNEEKRRELEGKKKALHIRISHKGDKRYRSGVEQGPVMSK